MDNKFDGYDSFLERIKELRKEKRISQKEMAETLGITQAGYSQIEKGKLELKVRQLLIIADKLGLDNIFQSSKKGETALTVHGEKRLDRIDAKVDRLTEMFEDFLNKQGDK